MPVIHRKKAFNIILIVSAFFAYSACNNSKEDSGSQEPGNSSNIEVGRTVNFDFPIDAATQITFATCIEKELDCKEGENVRECETGAVVTKEQRVGEDNSCYEWIIFCKGGKWHEVENQIECAISTELPSPDEDGSGSTAGSTDGAATGGDDSAATGGEGSATTGGGDGASTGGESGSGTDGGKDPVDPPPEEPATRPYPCHDQPKCEFEGQAILDHPLGAFEVVVTNGKYFIFKANSRDVFYSGEKYLDLSDSNFKSQPLMGHGKDLTNISRFSMACAGKALGNCKIDYISYVVYPNSAEVLESIGVGSKFYLNYLTVEQGSNGLVFKNANSEARSSYHYDVEDRYQLACKFLNKTRDNCRINSRSRIDLPINHLDSITMDGRYFNYQKQEDGSYTEWSNNGSFISDVPRYTYTDGVFSKICPNPQVDGKYCDFSTRYVVFFGADHGYMDSKREIITVENRIYFLDTSENQYEKAAYIGNVPRFRPKSN